MSTPRQYYNNGGRIENQYNTNFCSAYSTTSYLTAYFAKILGKFIEFSPLFAMKNSKDRDGRPDVSGTYLDTLTSQILKFGCCEEDLYPTSIDPDLFDNKFPTITAEISSNAKQYIPYRKKEIASNNVEAIKEAIRENAGCVFALNIYESYFNKYKGMFVRAPKKGDTNVLGGHGIYVNGYNDDLECEYDGKKYKGFFTYYESYGEKYSSKGFAYLPYEFVANSVTGLYSNDRLVKNVYCYEYKSGAVKFPNIHDNFKVYEPKHIIDLTLDSKVAYVNGEEKTMACPAISHEGRTMIPFRFLAEAFGCGVIYIQDTKQIRAYKQEPNFLIEMKIGDKNMIKSANGQTRTIVSDVPPMLINGNTMVPIRAVAELLDCKVTYANRKIHIEGMA